MTEEACLQDALQHAELPQKYLHARVECLPRPLTT
jgi:hypothetical protein